MTEGPDAEQESVAPGYKNAWIIQLGRASVDGSFADFVSAVTRAGVTVAGLNVRYNAPEIGEVTFGWEDEFTVNGQYVSLSGYPRFENPYSHGDFDSLVYEIEYQEMRLRLDFGNGIRVMG